MEHYCYFLSILMFFNINIFKKFQKFHTFFKKIQKKIDISPTTIINMSSKAPKSGGYPATPIFHHIGRVNTPGVPKRK